MSILNSLLTQTSSVKKICISFLSSHLILLIMMVYTFPIINTQIGTKAFDLQSLGYSTSKAQSIVNNLNEQTLNLYLFPQLTLLDLFYPFLLALFLSSLLFRLFNITKETSKITSILLIIPFLAMVFDYLENICIILMISRSIYTTESIVLLSSTFTILKGILTSITWLTILIFTIKWFKIKITKRKIKTTLN